MDWAGVGGWVGARWSVCGSAGRGVEGGGCRVQVHAPLPSSCRRPAPPPFQALAHASAPALPALPPPPALLAVVIGLQSTGEAAADSLGLQPGDQRGFISTTRQLLLHFVDNHFPTTLALEENQQQGQHEGAQGELESGGSGGGGEDASPGRQQQGQQQGGEEEPTSVQLKGKLLERIAGLDLPPNFLDEVRLRSLAASVSQLGRIVRCLLSRCCINYLPGWNLPVPCLTHHDAPIPACLAALPAPTLPRRLWTAWVALVPWPR